MGVVVGQGMTFLAAGAAGDPAQPRGSLPRRSA
jgi:hypothetical protein